MWGKEIKQNKTKPQTQCILKTEEQFPGKNET